MLRVWQVQLVWQLWQMQADVAFAADTGWRQSPGSHEIESTMKTRQLSDMAPMCFLMLCRLVFLAGLAQG